jgi:hypothetical protein
MRWTEDWTAVSVFTSLLISGPYQLRSSPVSGFFPVLRLDFQTLLRKVKNIWIDRMNELNSKKIKQRKLEESIE